MPSIDIRRRHGLDHAAARVEVAGIATDLARKFAMDAHWHGDELHFSRPGVDGHIAVGAEELRVHARLGLLLAPLKTAIEREIENHLERRFGA